MSAVLVGKVRDKYNPYRTDLVYEYRGKTYVITAYDNGYSESLRDQHKREQARIDEELDNSSPAMGYSKDTEEAFEKFFNYVETGVWKD